MPYINTDQKEDVARVGAQTPGQLNYAITRVLIAHRKDPTIELSPLIRTIIYRYWSREFQQSYTTINDIIGALEAAKFEFVRRIGILNSDFKISDITTTLDKEKDAFYEKIVVPYEKKKMIENGDVYETTDTDPKVQT